MPKSLEEFMNMSDDEVSGLVVQDVQETNDQEDNTDSNTSEEDINDKEDSSDDQEDRSVPDGDDGDDDGSDDDGNDGDADPSLSGSGDADLDDVAEGGTAKDQPDPKQEGLGSDNKGKEKPTGDAKSKKAPDEPKTAEVKDDKAVDYKAAYDQIMKPFKANGKEIKLESVQEAVQLMQMGANYTKKMQAIQPNLKILRMLENHQLLDEAKLSQLIDIQKGNKAAITKVMKDNSIDPMDIDTEDAVKYKPSNHTVSDAEINFQTVIEEATSTDEGQELIIHINNGWDQASKKAVFEEPELIRVLNAQKQDGIYDQIVDVIEKQKLLGNPQITKLPFIHAYKMVGEQLHQQGLLKPASNPQGNQQTTSQRVTQEIARAPAPKKKTVTNDSKARAASPSANGSKKATVSFNPLSGSDEEFLKAMASKV